MRGRPKGPLNGRDVPFQGQRDNEPKPDPEPRAQPMPLSEVAEALANLEAVRREVLGCEDYDDERDRDAEVQVLDQMIAFHRGALAQSRIARRLKARGARRP